MKETNTPSTIDNKYFLSHKDWKDKRMQAFRKNVVAKSVPKEKPIERPQEKVLVDQVALETEKLTDSGSFITCEDWKLTQSEISENVVEKKAKKKNKVENPVFTIRVSKRAILLNIAIVLLCFTGALFALYEYYNAVNASFEKLDEEPIGTIVYKYKVAQRKMIERVAWDRVKQNTPIYNGDLVRTAELSEATITFLDGSSIELFGQTLTQVYYDENGVLINFSGGDISVNASDSQDGIRLVAGETEVSLAKGSILNASAKTEQENGTTAFVESPVVLQLSSGDAQLLVDNNGIREELAVETGSSLLLDPATNSIDIPDLTLISPSTQQTYLKSELETFELPFEWTANEIESVPNSTLEISSYRDFSEIAQTHIFEATTNAAISLDKGSWYWRLSTADSELPLSGKVSILETNQLTQIAPANGEDYFYHTKTPSIRFVWSDDENIVDWNFEIADNAAMDNPIIRQNVTQPSSIINTLTDGTWYWRVTPNYSSRNVLSDVVKNYEASIQSFRVVQRAELLPATLISPTMNGFVNTQDESSPQFVWTFDREAVSYTISVSNSEDFTNPLFTHQTSDTFFALDNYTNELSEGIWYWTVAKTDSEGNISSNATTGIFNALDGEPVYETISPENASVFTEESISGAEFRWQNNLPFKTVLQVSEDSAFNTVLLEQELDTRNLEGIVSDFSIPLGSWYWRMVSINEETNTEYATDAKQFFVDFTLDTVVLASPRASTVLRTHSDSRQTFSWQEVEHSNYYNFEIYALPNRETPIFARNNLTTNTIRVDISDYRDGQYEWQVKAVSSTSPSGKVQETDISASTFAINKIKPVVLSGLSRPEQFNGVSSLLNPQSLSWSSSEDIVRSEFVLSKTNRGLRLSDIQNDIFARESDVVMRITNPSRSIQLEPLNEGTYYWTVIATTADGIDISAVEPRVITILPLDLLPSVTNMVPVQSIVFNNSDLRKGYIDFSWDKVANADEYHFVLYNQNNDIVWETMLGNEGSVNFTQISLLDRGTFTWSVEARRQLPNNTVQNGLIAKNTFTIDIGTQVVPLDKTTEGQYGF